MTRATIDAMTASLAELTADMTRLVGALIPRRDVIVRLNPELAVDGQFDAATAQIAINMDRVCTPTTLAELRAGTITIADVSRLVGVLAHEAGHAQHTPIRRLPPHLINWVDLLEEPRIEAALCRQHPLLREHLAESARHATAGTPIAAVTIIEAMILVGGRVHAGVFTAADAAHIRDAAGEALDPFDVDAIDAIVASAVDTGDDDYAGLLRLAERLSGIAAKYGSGGRAGTTVDHITGREAVDPDVDPADAGDGEDPDLTDGGTTTEVPDDDGGNCDSDPLDGTTHAAPASAPQEVPPAYVEGDPTFFSTTLGTARPDDWFTVRALPPTSRAHRSVTAVERTQVRALQSWLAGHHTEAPVADTSPSQTPRGRLNTRELIRATAQQQMGVPVTATPWSRRRIVERPAEPIELGIIADRSQSMSRHLEHVASAAWVLQQSIGAERGRARSWVFGTEAHILPAHDRDRIAIPAVDSHTLALLPAVSDYRRWVRPDHAAKVLIIISDGALYGDPVRDQLALLADSGVVIIGVTPRPTAVAALANHLPKGSPIEVLGPNLITQIQRHLPAD